MNARLPRWVFVALLAYAALRCFSLYPQLPAVMASHFDARGAANGWSSKPAFLGVFAGATAVTALLVFVVSGLMAIVPRELVNLPNKEYWLAPERLEASHRFLSAWFAWFGCAVYCVILVGFDYAVEWNLGVAEKPDPERLWYILVIFGGFTLVWIVRLMWRFGRVPEKLEMQ